MKTNNIFLIAVATMLSLFIFTACGEKKKDKITMTPITTEVSGALSKCYEVVDEECIVKLDGNELFPVWRIKLLRTDAPLPFEAGIDIEPYGTFYTDGRSYYHAGFGIEIVDEEDYTITESKATTGGTGGVYSSDDVKEILKLKPGEVGTIRWSVKNEKESTSALKFRISSAYDLVKGDGNTSSSSSSSYSSDDDDDIDLDDLDDAIEASKKAMKAASKAAKATNNKDVKEAMDAYNDALDAYSNMLK